MLFQIISAQSSSYQSLESQAVNSIEFLLLPQVTSQNSRRTRKIHLRLDYIFADSRAFPELFRDEGINRLCFPTIRLCFDALSIPRNNIHIVPIARRSSPRRRQCLPAETLQSVRILLTRYSLQVALNRTRGSSAGDCSGDLSSPFSLSSYAVLRPSDFSVAS